MTPGEFDFTIVRGTTQPFAVRISIDDVPIPNDAVIISIKTGATITHKSSADVDSGFTYDGMSGIATWIPTPAESRALKVTPDGEEVPPNSYEIELRNGSTQMVYLTGKITAIGGINNDD